jgi:ankyrin repeat protein
VRAIVAAGAAIDRPTPEGMTALMLAIDNNALDTAALLLELGANPHLWDWYGRTALYIAADKSTLGRGGGGRGGGSGSGDSGLTGLALIERLLDAGVDPNPQLNMHRPGRGGNTGRFSDILLTTGCTPLLRVAISGDFDAIQLLLGRGALVDLPNVMGVTPLMSVSGMGGGGGGVVSGGFEGEDRAIELLGLLLDAGADINARVVDAYQHSGTSGRDNNAMRFREGHTALFAAVGRGRGRIVDYLIERGADIDVVDTRGITPIDVARGAINDLMSESNPDVVSEELAARLEALFTTSD